MSVISHQCLLTISSLLMVLVCRIILLYPGHFACYLCDSCLSFEFVFNSRMVIWAVFTQSLRLSGSQGVISLMECYDSIITIAPLWIHTGWQGNSPYCLPGDSSESAYRQNLQCHLSCSLEQTCLFHYKVGWNSEFWSL